MNSNPLIKVSVKWALIMAGISSLSLFSTYLFGLGSNKLFGIILGILSFVITITILVFSNRDYRNTYLGGYINYGQCLANSILIFLFSSVVIALLSFLIYGVIDPDAFKQMIDDQLLAITSNPSIPAEWKEKQYDALINMTPLKQALMQLIGSIIFGAIISLIVSIFTRKKNNSFDGAIKEIE